MSSHFTSIGFPVGTPREFDSLAREVYNSGKKIKVKKGSYVLLSDDSDAEIYLKLNRRGEILDLNPHFHGKGRVKINLSENVEIKDDDLDGAFRGWLIDPPESDDPADELCPMIFNVPDFFTLKKKRFPFISDVQISAFAHELTLYDDEKDYKLNRKDNFASESFIPAGLFTPDGKKRIPPTAHAIFSGRILEHEKKLNKLTKKEFQWILVKSLGGKYDVVCDPSLISKEPKVGGLVSGVFWLSGQIEK